MGEYAWIGHHSGACVTMQAQVFGCGRKAVFLWDGGCYFSMDVVVGFTRRAESQRQSTQRNQDMFVQGKPKPLSHTSGTTSV